MQDKTTDNTLPSFIVLSSAATDIETVLKAYKREERTSLNAFARLCQLRRRLKRVARKECSPAEVMEVAFLMEQALSNLRERDTNSAMYALDKTCTKLKDQAGLELARWRKPKPTNPPKLRLIVGGAQ
jgi:hypothetical protein